jgi:hypothetical protein
MLRFVHTSNLRGGREVPRTLNDTINQGKERKQIMETINQGGNENVEVCQTFQNKILGRRGG